MSTASELLIQAQKLHSLQSYISVQAAQTPLHFATQQELAHKTTGSVSTPMATQQLPGNLQTAEAAQHEGVSANSERTAAAAEGDMAAIALDVVESQLPQWASRNSLDWSAQQDLSVHQPQVSLQCLYNAPKFALIKTVSWGHCKTAPLTCLSACGFASATDMAPLWLKRVDTEMYTASEIVRGQLAYAKTNVFQVALGWQQVCINKQVGPKSAVCMQIQLRYEPAGDLPIMRKFSFEERGEEIEVQPMWVLVHQEKPDGPAR